MLVRIVIFVAGFLTGFLGVNLSLHFTSDTPDGLYIKQGGRWRRIPEEAFKETDEDNKEDGEE